MAIEISACQLMEFYIDTIQKCGMYLLNANDADIEYYIFEEFDIGVTSFLHNNTLLKLKKAGLISEEIAMISADLRCRVMALQNSELWSVEAVKNTEEWKQVLELSDKIEMLLKQ